MKKEHSLDEKLASFLQQSIECSIERHKVELTPPAKQYLVEMLERFGETFELYQQGWLTPITFQYQHILEEASRLKRKQQQRELGDHCLFLVGYFYDFVRKHGEGQIRYHAQMGSSAYLQTEQLPLIEMGRKFNQLYLVISDLHLPQIDETKLVEIYQRWENTKDEYYASLLMGKGIMPRDVMSRDIKVVGHE
ncbi:MAG: hypothetical protein AABY40_01035 [Nanoarchaeota archaeon]